MRYDPRHLPPEVIDFMSERHLSTLTIVKPDGTPQVTPVGFTFDEDAVVARVITWADSYKAKLVDRSPGAAVALGQVDGGRWLTLSGTATLHDSDDEIRKGVTRYGERYRDPKPRPDRVVIRIDVTGMVGRVPGAE